MAALGDTAVVLRSGAIGDFVLTLPAIRALRQYVAPAQLRLIGRRSLAGFAPVDQIVDIDGAGIAPLFAPEGAVVEALAGDIGWVLAYSADLDGVLKKNLRCQVGGADIVVWDPRPPAGSQRHITEHLLAPLRRWGVELADGEPRIELDPSRRAWAEKVCDRYHLSAPLVAIHPGSGGQAKCWPLEGFVCLAEHLNRRGYGVMAALGPAEAEWAGALQRAGCQVVKPPDLLALAALLQRADLFIGNDSGPGHIAAAVGTATLSLFGPTDPQVWRPRHRAGRVLQARDGQMHTLREEEVLEQAWTFLQELC